MAQWCTWRGVEGYKQTEHFTAAVQCLGQVQQSASKCLLQGRDILTTTTKKQQQQARSISIHERETGVRAANVERSLHLHLFHVVTVFGVHTVVMSASTATKPSNQIESIPFIIRSQGRRTSLVGVGVFRASGSREAVDIREAIRGAARKEHDAFQSLVEEEVVEAPPVPTRSMSFNATNAAACD